MNGDQWIDKTNWLSSKLDFHHSWKGVKLHPKTGRVRKLILAENNLTGNLWRILLIVFCAGSNKFHFKLGTIPPEIGDLQELDEIDFRMNKLTGLFCLMIITNSL